MDEFNDMIGKQGYSEDQLNMCRDIRKRGKNKVTIIIIMVMIVSIMVIATLGTSSETKNGIKWEYFPY